MRLPAAFKTFRQWLLKGIKVFRHSLSLVASRIASFLHTAFTAVVLAFRGLTLKDIWSGFCDVLRAICVDLPANLWAWMQKFGVISYSVMKALGGVTGKTLWWIGRVVIWMVAYVSQKIWIATSSLGGSAAKGWRELMVWIDPKK